MKATPVNDFFAKDGRVREDGRMVHDMYLAAVKTPERSRSLGLPEDPAHDPSRPGVPAARGEHLLAGHAVARPPAWAWSS